MTDILALALADLARSGITPEDAEACELGVVESAQAEIHETLRPVAALAIPYFNADGSPLTWGNGEHFMRVRYYDEAPVAQGFAKRKVLRYSQPTGSGVRAYLPRFVDWPAIFADHKVPLVITEGEKKAIAANAAEFATIGLGGVFNFMSDGKFLPELEGIVWAKRTVYICFDSDAESNPDIRTAELRLVRELSTLRHADVRIVRIPSKDMGLDAQGKKLPNAKVGIDDYLVEHGPKSFEKLLADALPMGNMDKAVIDLNAFVAWIESEGQVYDLQTKQLIRKDNFTNGSIYSSRKVAKPGKAKKGGGASDATAESVAVAWLKHENAQRFADIVFRPDDNAEIVYTEHGAALNMWSGYEIGDGSVTPFLELSDHVFSKLPSKLRDFPIKLMAYKAQHPTEKIPIAPVLVGAPGSGKSLWCNIVREAFKPYSAKLHSQVLVSQFNGWVEKTLVAFIDEAKGIHVVRGGEMLKYLISEKRMPLNEKFRPARQVDSFTLYMLASNERSVGSYASDDRRMFVADVPRPREQSFYHYVADWLEADGNKALMRWLLEYDLAGWRPPQEAPLTAEKYMAYTESLTPIQRLAEDMRTADHNVVKLWIDNAAAYAQAAEIGNNPGEAARARDILSALARIQIRPWYTPEELAMMFPHIAASLQGYQKGGATPAGEISRQLRDAGITYLENVDDPRGFMHKGMVRQYLVVAQPEEFGRPLTQNEFDRQMANWPSYGTMVAAAKR